MRLIPVLVHYFWWHYTEAIADLGRNYFNVLVFLKDFFSLGHLTRNLFAPWRRMAEEYPHKFDLGAFFSVLIVNSLMRLVGFLIRVVSIVAGLIAVMASVPVFVVVLAGWLALPFIVVFLFVLSFRLLAA